jgi:hypothetical protein
LVWLVQVAAEAGAHPKTRAMASSPGTTCGADAGAESGLGTSVLPLGSDHSVSTPADSQASTSR